EDGEVVSPVELIQAGILKNVQDGVKILGNGEITKKLTVQANKFTATAKEKIEAAGGKAEVI
ncbi:MAG: uL15 family ribosomal protein, partial [Clostridia bacterium]|nr:uL15 family ribosomal protein [Clostridia bacterium]